MFFRVMTPPFLTWEVDLETGVESEAGKDKEGGIKVWAGTHIVVEFGKIRIYYGMVKEADNLKKKVAPTTPDNTLSLLLQYHLT